MPQINIEYNKDRVTLDEIKKVSVAIKKIVEDLTPERLVYVNATSFDYSLNSDPLEILIHLSQHLIAGKRDAYLNNIVTNFKTWKTDNHFSVPTNIILIPMDWDLRINV